MADDNSVEIRFGASTDDALAGIAEIREALGQLTEPVRDLDGNLEQLDSAFRSLPAGLLADFGKAVRALDLDAQETAAQMRAIGNEIKVLHQGLAEKKALLNAEANQFPATQNQKYAMLEAETQKEYEAELALLAKELDLFNLDAKQKEAVLDKITLLNAKHRTDMLKLDEQAIAQQQQMWTSALGAIEGAFNSQLRGLLAGTETWSKAFKSVLGDLVIKFIEACESMVVKWLAAELAKTTATTSGAAARAAAEQSSSATGVLAGAADAIQAIMRDAAQAFAGVFAFLAPVMGPAAAGPAAAAQASVSAAAIFDAGTDYVVRGGLALIHPGETIIPAARGSGPFSGSGAPGNQSGLMRQMLAAHESAMRQMVSSHQRSNASLESEIFQLRRRLR